MLFRSIPTQVEATAVFEDDRSLLDLFAESAKVYLTQQMVRHLYVRRDFCLVVFTTFFLTSRLLVSTAWKLFE